MPNTQTLTGFTELVYEARDIVLREPVGFASSVIINSAADGVSINGTVKILRRWRAYAQHRSHAVHDRPSR
jgi:hypothetical protein